MMSPRCRLLIIASIAWLSLPALWGCRSTGEMDLQREITKLKGQLEDRDNQLVAQRITIDKQHEQLQVCRAISDEDLKKIFYPEQIEIAILSGGDDYDGKPGDDGVTVYLRPLDRYGDALKVAGDIRIELYDLQNPSGQKLIGEYYFPVDQVAKLWYGKLATYHYSLRCPWQDGPPQHREITIRVTFVDYLTQRVLTAQTVREVKPSP